MDLNEVLRLIRAGESERIEFKKVAGKDIHREITALANAVGGHILIGVDDDGNIVGTDAKRDMRTIAQSVQSIVPFPSMVTHKVKFDHKEVLVIVVEKSENLCSVGGIAYIRIGAGIRQLSIQEILTLSAELGVIEWDLSKIAPSSYIDQKYLDHFFEKLEEVRKKKVDHSHRQGYLKSIGALKDGQLTNAGVLFFTDPSEVLPQAKIRLAFLENEEPVWSKEYTGPVWKTIEDVYSDILKEVGKGQVVVSAQRHPVMPYPPRAIREALINAVAHRNYVVQADIRAFITPLGLRIRSPGGLLPGVRLDDPEHVPRNPSLCNLLYDFGLIERYGGGINLMKAEVGQMQGLKMDFHITTNMFEVQFFRDHEQLVDDIDRNILGVLSEPKKSGEIADMAGVSKQSVVKHMKNLISLGLVKEAGAGPQKRYLKR